MTTKYLDTNYILRLIIKDDKENLNLIYELIDKAKNKELKLFVSTLVLFECEWVLRTFYKFEKSDIISILQNILKVTEFKIENDKILEMTLELTSSNNLGLEDNYHISYCIINNIEFMSFDQKANKIYQKLIQS